MSIIPLLMTKETYGGVIYIYIHCINKYTIINIFIFLEREVKALEKGGYGINYKWDLCPSLFLLSYLTRKWVRHVEVKSSGPK